MLGGFESGTRRRSALPRSRQRHARTQPLEPPRSRAAAQLLRRLGGEGVPAPEGRLAAQPAFPGGRSDPHRPHARAPGLGLQRVRLGCARERPRPSPLAVSAHVHRADGGEGDVQVHQHAGVLPGVRAGHHRQLHAAAHHLQEQVHEERPQHPDRQPGPGGPAPHHHRHPRQRVQAPCNRLALWS